VPAEKVAEMTEETVRLSLMREEVDGSGEGVTALLRTSARISGCA
jgi:hypothetical protein